MGTRRTGRILALQGLYSLELNPSPDPGKRLTALTGDVRRRSRPAEEFARKLVDGVNTRKDYLDRLISRYALKWPLDRIAVTDRHILRLALYEMIFCADDVTPAVCIDEAVELSKIYSTEDSYRFINGILNKVKEDWQAGKIEV